GTPSNHVVTAGLEWSAEGLDDCRLEERSQLASRHPAKTSTRARKGCICRPLWRVARIIGSGSRSGSASHSDGLSLTILPRTLEVSLPSFFPAVTRVASSTHGRPGQTGRPQDRILFVPSSQPAATRT